MNLKSVCPEETHLTGWTKRRQLSEIKVITRTETWLVWNQTWRQLLRKTWVAEWTTFLLIACLAEGILALKRKKLERRSQRRSPCRQTDWVWPFPQQTCARRKVFVFVCEAFFFLTRFECSDVAFTWRKKVRMFELTTASQSLPISLLLWLHVC